MTRSAGARAGRLFVVSGPSGAGKGTLIEEVLRRRPHLVLSVSATTRAPRPGERHGESYLFVSEEEFRAMREREEFLEWAEVFGHLYGTPRGPVEEDLAVGRDVILEIDIQGAAAVKRSLPEAVLIFVEPPSLAELSARLKGRGTEDPEGVGRRLQAAYDEVKAKTSYGHIVVNDEVPRAVAEFVRILDEESNRAFPDPSGDPGAASPGPKRPGKDEIE